MEAAKLWWIAARRRRLISLAAGAILLADGLKAERGVGNWEAVQLPAEGGSNVIIYLRAFNMIPFRATFLAR